MRRALAVLVLALALALPAAAATAKPPTGTVCVFRAAVHDTPRGLVVGYLHNDARVRLLGKTANRRWYRIRGPLALSGWMKAKSLCR